MLTQQKLLWTGWLWCWLRLASDPNLKFQVLDSRSLMDALTEPLTLRTTETRGLTNSTACKALWIKFRLASVIYTRRAGYVSTTLRTANSKVRLQLTWPPHCAQTIFGEVTGVGAGVPDVGLVWVRVMIVEGTLPGHAVPVGMHWLS